jgi:hypothetical protein
MVELFIGPNNNPESGYAYLELFIKANDNSSNKKQNLENGHLVK